MSVIEPATNTRSWHVLTPEQVLVARRGFDSGK
jgi:hypothetical protein